MSEKCEDKHRENMLNIMQDNQRGGIRAKQEEPPPPPPTDDATPVAAAQSASSSPSHEFSFTISLHPSSTKSAAAATKSSPASFALDLSPADDIFFHGHLLPLHLLAHLPVSPRSSTNSMDSFTLPVKNKNPQNAPNLTTQNNQTTDANKPKTPKSFSLFGRPKQRKGCQIRDREEKEKHWRKLKFEVSQVVKRYMKMVRPLLSFKGRRETMEFHRQTQSFSGNLNMRGRNCDLRGLRGEFSAPASTRTSPTNSGLLVAPATFSAPSDSTMEELQAAIQAAIAHCKNSISMDDKIPRRTPHDVVVVDPTHKDHFGISRV